MGNSDNDHHKPTTDRIVRQAAGGPRTKERRKSISRSSVTFAGQAEPSLSAQSDNLPDLIYTLDATGEIMALNQAINAYGYQVQELIGTSFFDLVHKEDRQWVRNEYEQVLKKKMDQIRSQQFRMVDKTGDVRWIEANCIFRFTPEGHFIMQEGVCRDISETIQNRNVMLKAQIELEEQVRIRTAELVLSNEELQKEIYDRRNTERRLRDREADLEMEKANLQETNTALKVLLKRREVDKHEFEEQVLYNIKELILPYLDKLKMVACDERQEAYLTILESNLSDITGSFTRRLAMDSYGLTNSELKVANFIRQGKKTREIASLLGISSRTVEAYRLGIRRKMRIQGRKVNLRTFLMSLN
jgi:PAS domain S-box-containing protein